MIILRKRLIIWLLRAYVKRWGKLLLLLFFLGFLVFFIILQLVKNFAPKIPVGKKESIGIVGSYTFDQLPLFVLKDLSKGLTLLKDDGQVMPLLVKSWKIENDGKKYTFYLKNDLFFNDKSRVTSEDINYNFSGVKLEKPDKFTIVFNLNESYSPFLAALNRPVLKKRFIGIGEYKLKDLELNGQFIRSIILVNAKDDYKIKIYQFYPSSDALKLAFVMGEVNKALGISDLAFQKSSFEKFKNIKIDQKINYKKIVTLFYNNNDPVLSDKKIRNALSYSLPDEFSYGQRAYSPISVKSWAYAPQHIKYQDLEHADILFSQANTSTESAKVILNIKTLPKYIKTAELVAKYFNKLNLETKIETVDTIPNNFQVFLGDFGVPNDPDQYVLWHSSTEQNITKFKNMRIDKLLEDGRKTSDIEERRKIYSDFQKYLLDESPATFLYFPYEYDLSRK